MVRSSLLLCALLAGCSSDPKSPANPGDTGSTPELPTVPPTETGTPGDTGTPAPPSGIEAHLALHPQVSTVVNAGWVQPEDADIAWIGWTVGGEDRTTPTVPRTAGPQSEVLLGTPPGTPIEPVLHWIAGGKEHTAPLGTITTGPLPQNLIAPVLVRRDPAGHRPEPWLLTSVDVGPMNFFGPFYTVILDLDGRIVWYHLTSDQRMTWQVEAHEGFVTMDASTVYRGNDPEILRVTLDLRQVEAVLLPGFAQAYTWLPDGTILFQETDGANAFWLSRRNPTGSFERLWDCNAWMDPWSTQVWACAANTITHYPARGSVMYSMFEIDTVVEIDDTTGELLREFGRYPGGFAFDPPNTTFEHQHLPMFTDQGTLFTQTDDPSGTTQWAREYEIDDATGTLREIWSLRTPHFADYAGQAQPLPSGNVLWQHGTAGAIEELTRDGDVVWAVDWNGHLTGNATAVADLYALNAGW